MKRNKIQRFDIIVTSVSKKRRSLLREKMLNLSLLVSCSHFKDVLLNSVLATPTKDSPQDLNKYIKYFEEIVCIFLLMNAIYQIIIHYYAMFTK